MRTFVRIMFPVAAVVVVMLSGATIFAENLTGGRSPKDPISGGSQSLVGNPPSVAERASTSLGDKNQSPPYFDRFVAAGAIQYGVANNQGVFVSLDGGHHWQVRDEGLPRRFVYPFDHEQIQTLTAIGVDPFDPSRVAVTTSDALWASNDAGRRWRQISVHPPVKGVAYITSVAISPWSSETFAVGTSFSGVFETTDDGDTWMSRADHLKFLYRGAGFYEEIAGLSYSPIEKGALLLGVGFGGGVYQSNRDKSMWISIGFPKGHEQIIRQMAADIASGQPVLSVESRTERWVYDFAGQDWRIVGKPPAPPPVSAEKARRIKVAAGRSGLYLAAANASGKRLERMIRFAKENGLNTLVVDVKDDFGRLTYDSRLPLPRRIGAVDPLFNLRTLIKTAHESGMYVVGRMVIFQDEKLYSYDHHRYAIWNRVTDKPWGELFRHVDSKTGKVSYDQRQFWVDPFSEDVWTYNVAIAKEIQSMGIDEIQFDYIRFPSGGPISQAEYRYRRPGMSRIDALESFMVMAREAIKVPISTDLFGFNCWYRMGNWIGQNTAMFSKYADVVCPMYYPSLFPTDFMGKIPYLERAKDIYYQGTRRAQEIVEGRADIRPFVQAFLLLDNEVKMDRLQYSQYLRLQLEGAKEAHASGFTLWNAGNDYYMITEPLTPYVEARSTEHNPTRHGS